MLTSLEQALYAMLLTPTAFWTCFRFKNLQSKLLFFLQDYLLKSYLHFRHFSVNVLEQGEKEDTKMFKFFYFYRMLDFHLSGLTRSRSNQDLCMNAHEVHVMNQSKTGPKYKLN